MTIKTFSLITLILMCATPSSASELVTVSSKARGISAFDFTVQEVKRLENHSELIIKDFQKRSAPASRWMMCAYNEIAVSRNAKLWAAIYTDDSGDNVTLVFPDTKSLEDPAFNGVDLLGTSPLIAKVSTFNLFCGGANNK